MSFDPEKPHQILLYTCMVELIMITYYVVAIPVGIWALRCEI